MYIQFASLFILIAATVLIWSIVFAKEGGGVLTVAFLDVGQGDAIFIETPSGNQILLDGGPDKKVLRELGKLMPFWDRSINMVIASHPDTDHIGGLPSVVDRFDVEYYMRSAVVAQSDVYEVLESAIERGEVETIFARRGDVVDLGDGVVMEILFPDRNTEGFDPNVASIIAKVSYGDTSFLLTGDSPAAIEEYLVSLDGSGLDVDVLKLGHHGSKTSSGEMMLGAAGPRYAVISAGENNRYGHPHKEVLERLDQFGIPYLETSENGAIVFESDGTDIVLR